MKRKIDAKLHSWKESSARKPLVLRGARQVGKTYAVEHFARNHFTSLVKIDFAAQASASGMFEGVIEPKTLIPLLKVYAKQSIDPDTTLIFFDEVQECARALTSLKYFQEQAPQYHVIAAGSLLGVALQRDDYSFPVGKVDSLELCPMDFEEYLWARDEGGLADLIQTSYDNDVHLLFHEQALALYDSYVLSGGLPEVLASAIDGGEFAAMRRLQNLIVDGYLADMTKYAAAIDSAKILNVWRSVPEQLAKENHKFQYATIASSARAHQYEAPINWLKAAGLINLCTRVSEGRAPLKAFEEQDFFKIYLLDVGILTALYQAEPSDLAPDNNKAARFRGGVTENYVMQQLLAQDITPHYWGTASQSEVEFIFRNSEGQVIPIEVKSGKNVTSRSLTAYKEAHQPNYIIRCSRKNFGFEKGIRFVPLYAVHCIR